MTLSQESPLSLPGLTDDSCFNKRQRRCFIGAGEVYSVPSSGSAHTSHNFMFCEKHQSLSSC